MSKGSIKFNKKIRYSSSPTSSSNTNTSVSSTSTSPSNSSTSSKCSSPSPFDENIMNNGNQFQAKNHSHHHNHRRHHNHHHHHQYPQNTNNQSHSNPHGQQFFGSSLNPYVTSSLSSLLASQLSNGQNGVKKISLSSSYHHRHHSLNINSKFQAKFFANLNTHLSTVPYDICLMLDNNELINAHKIVLANSSNYFRRRIKMDSNAYTLSTLPTMAANSVNSQAPLSTSNNGASGGNVNSVGCNGNGSINAGGQSWVILLKNSILFSNYIKFYFLKKKFYCKPSLSQ